VSVPSITLCREIERCCVYGGLTERKELVPGESSAKYTSAAGPQLVVLPRFHVPRSPMTNSVKASDKNFEGLNYLK
jgi:hypothetical protein